MQMNNITPPLPYRFNGQEHGDIIAYNADEQLLLSPNKHDWQTQEAHQISFSYESKNENLRIKIIQVANLVQVAGDTETDCQKIAQLITLLRKNQHIALCATTDVEAKDRFTGFSEVALIPKTLPEMSWDELDLRAHAFQRTFSAPIMIAGMTFGVDKSESINNHLADCACHFNLPMGIGSQRVALTNKISVNYKKLKRSRPDLFLIANLGSSHLQRDLCLRAVEMIEADALAIHLNILQELVQTEGDRDFRHLLARLADISSDFPVPLIVKEVGCGIDVKTAKLLQEGGINAFDLGGKGGTAWGWIEGLRCAERKDLAHAFRNWGIPTAFNIPVLRAALPTALLIATGGIRDGLTVAKALALGADFVGIGLPLLRAALHSAEQTVTTMETFIAGLQIALLVTGSRQCKDLRLARCYKHPYYCEFQQLLQENDDV